jgi:hypothetical protein
MGPALETVLAVLTVLGVQLVANRALTAHEEQTGRIRALCLWRLLALGLRASKMFRNSDCSASSVSLTARLA